MQRSSSQAPVPTPNFPPDFQAAGADPRESWPEGLRWLQAMPAWALSAVLHTLFLVFLASLVYTDGDGKPVQETAIGLILPPVLVKAPKPPEYDAAAPRSTRRTPKLPDIPTLPDVEVSLPSQLQSDEGEDGSRGQDPDNQLNFLTDLSPITNPDQSNDGLGIGGGIGSALGKPWCNGRVVRIGAPPHTEDAVRAALEWLRRHQSSDGGWRCRDFTESCRQPCGNADPRHGDGRGWKDHDAGATGLAMLAMTGFGHTHRDGVHEEYVVCLGKAMEYLKSRQVRSDDPNIDGRIGGGDSEQWIYDHAIATMALAELLAMSGDAPQLKRPVTDAVKLCLRARNPEFGWKYGIQPGRNDTSVTGWMVLALKAAKRCKLDIPPESIDEAIRGALAWIELATASGSGKTGYESPGDEGSALRGEYPDPYPFSKELSCMTAVGVLCRMFAGQSRSEPVIRRGIDILLRERPQWQDRRAPDAAAAGAGAGSRPGARAAGLSRINLYYWYYASYALFQYGGKSWKDWNESMLEALIPSQRQGVGRCEDGSWDPIDEWGRAGGRVYSTALVAMTLEVYYRFRRLREGAAD